MIREELILQYFDQELSKEESLQVEAWAKENPADFALYQNIWHESSFVKDVRVFDTELAWDDFMQELESSEKPQSSTPIIPITAHEKTAKIRWFDRYARPLMVACSIMLVAVVAYFLFPRETEIEYHAQKDDDQIELPDNTTVSLVDGATITYPSTFDQKKQRVVKLDGVAIFDVTHNPDMPFIVVTNNSGIRVLGTVFRVDGTQENSTEVKNIEGLIRFYDRKNESFYKDVQPGESFVFDGNAFTETTPLPPTVKVFEAPEAPEIKTHSVKEILEYMYIISNGNTRTIGNDFNMNQRIAIDLETEHLANFIQALKKVSNLKIRKTNCSDCYEISRLKK